MRVQSIETTIRRLRELHARSVNEDFTTRAEDCALRTAILRLKAQSEARVTVRRPA